VNYDPALAEYVDYSSDADFDSVNVDEKNGVIKFACASLNEVEAGDAVAEFRFKTTCDDSSVSMTTKERNDEIDLNEESTETIKGTGHNYYLSAWIWEEDYSGAKVYFTCKNSSDHREVIPAVVTKTTVEPTADRAGQIVYLASAWFMGREYTDTRTIVLPPTGSGSGSGTVYELVGFEWSDDYSKAYAIFKDPATGKTTRIEAAIGEVRVEPTVNEDGSVTYTATVVYDGKTYTDTKTVVLEKLDGDGSATPGEKDDDKSGTAPEQKDDKKEDADVPEDQNKDADKKKTLSILDAVFSLATLGLGIYMALKGGFIGLLIAALSLVGFFLTQSLSGSLIVADKWSILLGALMIINIIQAFFDKKFRR
jgi:hypothetical protein